MEVDEGEWRLMGQMKVNEGGRRLMGLDEGKSKGPIWGDELKVNYVEWVWMKVNENKWRRMKVNESEKVKVFEENEGGRR